MASQEPQLSLDDALSITFATQCYVFTILTLVVYDWLINLDEEIRCFWDFRKGRRKFNVGALLYGLSRYPPIIHLALVVQTNSPISSTVCQINNDVQTVILVLYALTPAAFSAIRVYALWPNNKAVPLFTFLLLFVPGFVVLVINSIIEETVVLPSPLNCTSVLKPSISATLSTGLQEATRACSIAGDILVLFVTWFKTYTAYRAQKGVLRAPSLVRVMLHNGSVYFMAITIMNGVCMIPEQTIENFLFGTFASSIISPLTAVLTCHFLLALHRADRIATSTQNSVAPSSASLGLHFAAAAESQLEGSPTLSRSRGTAALPAFIASMGEQVHIGSHFADGMEGTGWDEDEIEAEAENGAQVRGSDDSRSEGGAREDGFPASHRVEDARYVTRARAEA